MGSVSASQAQPLVFGAVVETTTTRRGYRPGTGIELPTVNQFTPGSRTIRLPLPPLPTSGREYTPARRRSRIQTGQPRLLLLEIQVDRGGGGCRKSNSHPEQGELLGCQLPIQLPIHLPVALAGSEKSEVVCF
jgi:hypothetical protein